MKFIVTVYRWDTVGWCFEIASWAELFFFSSHVHIVCVPILPHHDCGRLCTCTCRSRGFFSKKNFRLNVFGSTFLEMQAWILCSFDWHTVCTIVTVCLLNWFCMYRGCEKIFENLKRRSEELAAGKEEARRTAIRMTNRWRRVSAIL